MSTTRVALLPSFAKKFDWLTRTSHIFLEHRLEGHLASGLIFLQLDFVQCDAKAWARSETNSHSILNIPVHPVAQQL
jgi:hypothetical protein